MQIKVENGGERLDIFLTKHFEGSHSRSQITNSIKSGKTTVNGKVVKGGTVLCVGDVVDVDISVEDIVATPEDIKIDIVYQDDHLIIINKQRGMVVHPGAGNRSGTLLNALMHLQKSESNLDRAGIVHRLDKNTAGLMVVAKSAVVQASLAKAFERHEVKRTYIGLVEGKMPSDSGTISANITRDPNRRTLFKTVSTGGRRAVTHYKVLQVFEAIGRIAKYSLVQFNLETGRTHQIRVHAKHLSCPLVGDHEYNPKSSIKVDGQLLESVEIEFTHPITGKTISHKIELTKQFSDILNMLDKKIELT